MKHKRILIVEDEGVVAINTKITLMNQGYEVLPIAISAKTALDLTERERPDLVLMDIKLRGTTDGIEAALQIWDNFRIPAVFVTAYATREVMDRIGKTPHFGFLEKPVTAGQLKPAIEKALERFYSENSAN